eukprot:4017325-Heterocapsa_arctica.AAC.1
MTADRIRNIANSSKHQAWTVYCQVLYGKWYTELEPSKNLVLVGLHGRAHGTCGVPPRRPGSRSNNPAIRKLR